MAAMRALVRETVAAPGFVKAVFSGPRRGGEGDWIKVSVRRAETRCHFERFTRKQSFSKTVAAEDLVPEIDAVLDLQFSSIHLLGLSETVDIRIGKKGKVFCGRKAVNWVVKAEPHNRVKALPIPENEANPLLQTLGILDRQGNVKPTMRAKFTQVNEFLNHFLHEYEASGLAKLDRPIEILDAGCGSSFLTLAVHDLLHRKLKRDSRIIGVDVNDDVIRKSMVRAVKLGADAVEFVCSKIDAAAVQPDVVIALHACDTATDAALAAAIKHDAKLILCVPCCHHHLNEQLQAANAEVLRPILRHGLLHERQADLITDAFRALILKLHGYRVSVVEFIAPEHTARNLMIRAVKSVEPNPLRFLKEYEAMKAFFGVTPHLETLLPPLSIVE